MAERKPYKWKRIVGDILREEFRDESNSPHFRRIRRNGKKRPVQFTRAIRSEHEPGSAKHQLDRLGRKNRRHELLVDEGTE